jgi:hypothetical protein
MEVRFLDDDDIRREFLCEVSERLNGPRTKYSAIARQFIAEMIGQRRRGYEQAQLGPVRLKGNL